MKFLVVAVLLQLVPHLYVHLDVRLGVEFVLLTATSKTKGGSRRG